MTRSARRVRRNVLAVIRLFNQRELDLTSADFDARAVRQFAAAGLARCVALLKGIYVLCGSGRGEVAGVLLRSLCETWAVASYVFLTGNQAIYELATTSGDALERIAGADPAAQARYAPHIARLRRIADKSKQREKKTGKPRETTFKETFERLSQLLDQNEGAGAGKAALTAYGSIYRIESTISTHGGLLSIEPYLDSRREPWSIRRPPRRPYADENIQATAGILTADLGGGVCAGFGFQKQPWFKLLKRMAPAVEGKRYPRSQR